MDNTNYELEALEMWLDCSDSAKTRIIENTIGREITKQDIMIEFGSEKVKDKAFEEWMAQFHKLQVNWKEKNGNQ